MAGALRPLGVAVQQRARTVNRSHLRALTGMRFLAAFQVLVFHCSGWQLWASPALARNIAGSGFAAVSFFFILSGFILTYVYGRPGAPAIDRRDFYTRRFARIYPAYAFGLALIGPFFLVHTARIEGLARLFVQALPVVVLVQAYLPSDALAWNPPAWSLSVEALFYALFPFLMPRLLRCGRAFAVVTIAFCYALSLLASLAYLRFAPDGPTGATSASYAFWLNVLRYNPAVRLPEFVLGIALGRLYLEAEARPREAARMGGAALSFLALFAFALVLCTLAWSPFIPYALLHNGLLAPVFALLVVALAPGRGPVAALLGAGPLVALGEASYCLYVVHIPLLVLWGNAVGRLASAQFIVSQENGVSFMAFAILASLLCHRYVEQPLQGRVLSAFGKGRAARRQMPAPTP